MKKSKIISGSLLAALLAVPVLTGCNEKDEPRKFDFSIDLNSGRNELEVGDHDIISVFDNGVAAEADYFFRSSNPEVASINQSGAITAKGPGTVSFQVEDRNSGKTATLPMEITVVAKAELANGGYNFAAGSKSDDINRRTKILSKLEKYAMDSHLTGITLFDNGGLIKYSSRVNLPTREYITGYGFGLLREGSINSTPLPKGSTTYPTYYHSAISQDTGTINALNASGSQVSGLSGYITSSYWSTKMNENKTGYDWYPVLAADKVYKPVLDADGNVTGNEATLSDNTDPIPLEKENSLGMYRKWRIYLRKGLQYRFQGDKADLKKYEKRNVALEDYEFIYKLLLTGINGQSRGAEMAGDTAYGIKGAQKFYNATLKETNQTNIDNLWNNMKEQGKLGIHVGKDDKQQPYIDLEILNAVDAFTAKYNLSSSLVSPLPRSFFEDIGAGAGDGENVIAKGAERYGNFNGGGADAILNYTLNLGPYMLKSWTKKQAIAFARNDDWFEVDANTYRIPGIYNRVIDTSTDNEAGYKQFNDGALDVTGIPTSKVDLVKNDDDVLVTKGDSTFKLNVNSCDEARWEELFGSKGSINVGSSWKVKPWMSNNNFLNGLFFAINREEFATKRGVQPSINYFSDAYMSNPKAGADEIASYNETPEHEAAVSAYHTVQKDPSGKVIRDNYGYDFDKAVQSFKLAVNQLSQAKKITFGTKKKPTVINLHIKWMYQTDPKEYGADIKHYFEAAFNAPEVSDGRIKLNVTQDAVQNWEDVYNEVMMKGQFDLGFGAISGNTLNPLNFLEVLKSDNSSGFTLNWGADTGKVDPVHPIIFEDPNATGETKNRKWSFDALWEVADHGGVVETGEKKPAIKSVSTRNAVTLNDGTPTNELYKGYKVEIPVEFRNVPDVEFGLSHLDIYVPGKGNVELKNVTLNAEKTMITAIVTQEEAEEINSSIFESKYKEIQNPTEQQLNPFRDGTRGSDWDYELYYTIQIRGGAVSEAYTSIKA